MKKHENAKKLNELLRKQPKVKGVRLPGKIHKLKKIDLSRVPEGQEMVEITVTTTGSDGRKRTSSGGVQIRPIRRIGWQ